MIKKTSIIKIYKYQLFIYINLINSKLKFKNGVCMKNFNRNLILSLTTLCLSIAVTNSFADTASNLKTVSSTENDLKDNPQTIKYVRKSVFSPNNVDLEGYKLAVKLMKDLPKTDRRNWYFQSGIHGYFNPYDKDNKSKFIQSVSLKPENYNLGSKMKHDVKDHQHTSKTLAYFKDSDGKLSEIQAWDLCHEWGADNSLFLLWHRVYVYSFENIARELLSQKTQKTSNFALPYWDYTDQTNAQKSILPKEFNTPKNTSNSLYVEGRSEDVQKTGIKPEYLKLKDIMNSQSMDSFSNNLERGVHNKVHLSVGDANKDYIVMGQVPSAAQDPIFWLHHSNIDRIWACWNSVGHNNTQFKDNGIKYSFVQPDGSVKQYSVQEMQDLVAKMDYGYESFKDCATPLTASNNLSNVNTLKLSSNYSGKIQNQTIEIPFNSNTVLKSLKDTPVYEGSLILGKIKTITSVNGLYEIYLKAPDIKAEVLVDAISFFGTHPDTTNSDTYDISEEINSLISRGANINNIKVIIKPDSRLTTENKAKNSHEFEISDVSLELKTAK